jgi:chaperonin GroEL
MGKRLEFDDAARASLLRGVEQLAAAVRVTLGPRGRTVVLESGASPTITNHGPTVASAVELADPFEDLGVRMVREAAQSTGEEAGDGTTTATVLAHALVTRGLQAIAAGHDAVALKRGIEHAAAAALEHLAATARRVEGPDDLLRVATVSAGGDPALGRRVADAVAAVGPDGVVLVDTGAARSTTLAVVEGVRFEGGWLSPYFVTAPDRMEAVLEHPLVLLADVACSEARELVPALEVAARARRPLLVVAADVTGEALATLVVNRMRGTAPSAAVRAGESAAERRALLEDLAALTGATLVAADLGRDLAQVTEADLGRARRVVIERETTTLLEGGGRAESIRAHAAALERVRDGALRERDRDAAAARLARVRGRLAVLRAGGASESAVEEARERLEGAVAATRAALAEGVVTGGGVALVRAQAAVRALPPAIGDDERRGRAILCEALEEPARWIAINAGADGAAVLERVRAARGGEGYDAERGVFADLDAAGVTDPARVVRAALQHAASVGAMVLTTDAIVVDAGEEDEAGEGGDEDAADDGEA